MTHDEARAHGNTIRLSRAALRKQMWNGEIHAADVIAAPPAFAASMRLYELLDRAPPPHITGRSPSPWTSHTHNKRKPKRWLRQLNIRAALANVNLFSELGELSDRQRAWLVAELRRLYRLPMTAGDYAVLKRRPFERGVLGEEAAA